MGFAGAVLETHSAATNTTSKRKRPQCSRTCTLRDLPRATRFRAKVICMTASSAASRQGRFAAYRINYFDIRQLPVIILHTQSSTIAPLKPKCRVSFSFPSCNTTCTLPSFNANCKAPHSSHPAHTHTHSPRPPAPAHPNTNIAMLHRRPSPLPS